MDKSRKQEIINEVTNALRDRQWFNGAGFPTGDTLTVAYNFFPAFEMVQIRTFLSRYGIEYELRDIRQLRPDLAKDEQPPYIR